MSVASLAQDVPDLNIKYSGEKERGLKGNVNDWKKRGK